VYALPAVGSVVRVALLTAVALLVVVLVFPVDDRVALFIVVLFPAVIVEAFPTAVELIALTGCWLVRPESPVTFTL
jgi:diacylglycerol kinase